MRERIALLAAAIVFGLLHLIPLFQGIANLVALPAYYAQLGIGEHTPWWLLVLGVALPPVAFTAALLIGRGRIISHRVALLLASLATVNALVLSAGALAPILLAFAAGA
ncbi:MAG TPA: hypothetical protein VNR36_07780 [Pseudolysinimonas sp.]|nr:hypothetical protein [Pseudolysinimonas sp.]